MYQFKEDCNQTQFFWWPKKLIKNKNWAILPAASKAIWPVIASHCNQKGTSFPGERTIGILAGRTDKKVRAGISGLNDFPDFRVEYYNTMYGRRSKKFHVELSQRNVKGSAFPFHKLLLESGVWRELKPSAQALYPVMRCFGFFDLDMYQEFEIIDEEVSDFDEVYKNREFDYCHAHKDILAELAGVGRKSIYRALDDLIQCSLLEQINFETYRIFLRMREGVIYKRSYLNQKIIDAYRHELQK